MAEYRPLGKYKRNSPFQGMVLNFKKRRFFANHDDTSDYQYTIFGYYDVMSIRPCYNWFQFSPSALEIAENYEYGSEY